MTSSPSFQRARDPEQKEQRRQDLLAAARRLIVAHGVAAVGLSDIAREVGLAKSNLYRYFASREEILLAPEELKIMWKLRRVLSALDPQQGIELLLDRLKKTKSNYEFLVQVGQTSSIRLDDDEQA